MKLRILTAIVASVVFSSYAFADGYDEPGYLNYNSSDSSNVTKVSNLGRNLQSGIFEPGYVNYQFESQAMDINALIESNPTAAGDGSGFWLTTGHVNEYGVYEPIYLDFNLDN